MLTNKQAGQTSNTNTRSIFEDRRKIEGIKNANNTSNSLNRRQSNFNNCETWYLRASINNSI